MKTTAAIALFAFAMLPFSACSSNNGQDAYMQSTNAEQNAREAEQAEEEFAQLASKEETPKAEKTAKVEKKSHKVEKTAKAEKKPTPKHEDERQPASNHETHHAVAHADHGSQRVYTVQLGAFKVKENAEKLTAKLKTEGFPVMMVNKEDQKGLFIVHLEPTPNKNEAEKWQTDLKLKAFDSTLTSKHD